MSIRGEFLNRFSPGSHPSMCPLLFNHFSTETRGEIKFCCEATFTTDTAAVDGKNKKIIEIFNGDYYNKSRQKMISGEKIPECDACWIKEKNGLISKRLDEWEVFQQQTDNPLPVDFKEWEESGKPLVPTYYNLQVSKTCNYACIMCSVDWSSLITSIGQRMGEEKKSMLVNNRWWEINPSQIQLDKSDTFWEGLRDISDKLENLYVTGGEPFIIKPLWEYINFLVDQGYAGNISFWCNTNVSQFSEHQLTLLKSFKRVELNLSIDAYGTLNEFLRTGSNWDTIEKNVDLAIKHVDDNFILTLVPVISGLNVRHVSELIYWWRGKTWHTDRCMIKPITLSLPRTMTINVLPEKYVKESRKLLVEAINDCKLTPGSDFENIFNLLDNHQFSPRANKKLKEEFEYFKEAANKDYFALFSYLFE